MFNPRLRTAVPKSFALRQARAARPIRSVRWQSTQSASVSGGSSGAAVGAASGAAAALVVCYGLYQYSGLSRVAQVSKQANQAYEQTKQKVQEAVPEPNEAIQWLRKTANSYAWFIPGAKQYIDVAFNDLETIRQQHGPEVDQIVKDTYNELKEATQGSNFNTETAAKVVSILQSKVEEIGKLAGDAAEKILDNHPDIKNKVGGSLDQLKQLGNSLGPEAKQEVDKTWDQIRELLSAGISVGTADKLRKIVQEKVEKLRQMGDQAWQKGMEQAKPYLDKSPKVKEIVEQNADQLKSGNIMQLWDKVKDAASSGNTADLESFVKQTVDKAKQQNLGGLEKYLDMIPGGSQILPQLQQLSQIAQKNGKEAEDLLHKTVEDIKQILSKRSEEAKSIAEKAKNEAS